MTINKKQTSDEIASLASGILQDKNASKIAKTLAGSALSQASGTKQTGAELEEIAAKALRSPKYSEDTKALAGSVLSQANKDR